MAEFFGLVLALVFLGGLATVFGWIFLGDAPEDEEE